MDAPRYGKPNNEWFTSVLQREEPGGPMWALNFMKYRAKAEYADGRESTLTGAEADDAYTPLGPLAAVGASLVFVGGVVTQLQGDDTIWDRIGVVRYPTRRAIIDMNMREDFQEKHAHKEAGMESTIVVASFPEETGDDPGDGLILLQLVADADAPDLAADIDSTRIGRFSIEAAMIGDGRTFAEARYDRISRATADELAARPPASSSDSYAVIVDTRIDELVSSTKPA